MGCPCLDDPGAACIAAAAAVILRAPELLRDSAWIVRDPGGRESATLFARTGEAEALQRLLDQHVLDAADAAPDFPMPRIGTGFLLGHVAVGLAAAGRHDDAILFVDGLASARLRSQAYFILRNRYVVAADPLRAAMTQGAGFDAYWSAPELRDTRQSGRRRSLILRR